MNLQAGNNVDIGAATETDTHYRLKEKKKSGLLGSGGIGFTIGKQSSKHEIDEKAGPRARASAPSAAARAAPTSRRATNCTLAAPTWRADLALTGDSVTIDPGYDQRTRKETFEQKQSGLSVAVGRRGRRAQHRRQLGATGKKGRRRTPERAAKHKAALSGVQAAQAWERTMR